MKHQIDCFNLHLKFFKYLGIWSRWEDQFPYYNVYSKLILFLFSTLYVFFFTINLIFLEPQLDKIVEELILFLTMISVTSKVFTFLILHDDIDKILSTLESNIFQPNTATGANIISKAKKMNRFYWKLFAVPSVTSNIFHAFVPLILNLTFGSDLYLPVCSYVFISDNWRQMFIYPLYFYQVIGIHINMWYNVNVDSFFLGLMNLTIAQLEILDDKLRKLTESNFEQPSASNELRIENFDESYENLKDSVKHYIKVADFCWLIEDTFSITLFIQFNIAAYVICVCLFRLTLPSTPYYFVFLSSYVLIMVLQILIPCWFGHQITDKSVQLSVAIYNCDWVSCPRQFTSSLRIIVERARHPLSITGGKIFPLMLTTFTSIANSAYSFYTLLRNVQNEE